jgi:hypothetical protein
VPVDGLALPILIDMSVSRDLGPDPSQISCAYYDPVAKVWSQQGVIAVGYRADPTSGNLIVTCATLHLSAFTSYVAPYAPTANTVDPIGDAGLLANYLNPNNFYPLAVLISLVGGFGLAWLFAYFMQIKHRKGLGRLREAHMVRSCGRERERGQRRTQARAPAFPRLYLRTCPPGPDACR